MNFQMTGLENATDVFSANEDTLVLASVTSPAESDLLDEWLLRQRQASGGAAVDVLRLPAGPPTADIAVAAAELLLADPRRNIVPARVFWVPAGLPTRVKLIGLLAGRDTYRPPKTLQGMILRKDPARARIVTGQSAKAAELRRQWVETTDGNSAEDFGEFVIRRARLAIERVEYRLLGPEYKSPKLVKPEMLASSRFRAGLKLIPGATVDAAGEMLDELATGWSRFAVDLVPQIGRMIFRRGFDANIDYDLVQTEAMRAALDAFPAVMLFSHRSNLDSLVLSVALQENGLPRAHLFGGVNMAIPPFGTLLRRAGVIYIRRSFGDDALYKYVLKEYVGYLAEKRFNMTWSIEGTRSRTGKMLPPKLGLLSYVVDAYLAGRSEDILLQPVSISFDQLHETAEYADYARGAEKKPEGLSWFVGFVKAQRERSYGKIYVRFASAVSVRAHVGSPHDAPDQATKRLALQKMAFEVAWRIQQATPINATGLVSTLLLATRGVALTLSELHQALQELLDYLERRQTAMTDSAMRLRSLEGVRTAVEALSGGHPLTCVAGGREAVWYIASQDEHQAAFYRNSVIHAFLETSLIELALVRAANADEDRVTALWAQVSRLRDLLKFEFYFADSTAYNARVAAELDDMGNWKSSLTAGGDAVDTMVGSKRPLVGHCMLRPFIEAYVIVADVLVDAPADISVSDLTKRAMSVGRQYLAQGRVGSAEAVSALLFNTAGRVAADQFLLEPGDDLQERRYAFSIELLHVLSDLNRVEELWRQRYPAFSK